MSQNLTRISTGIQLQPTTAVLSNDGEAKYDSSISGFVVQQAGATGQLVLTSSTGTTTLPGLIINGNETVTGTLSVSGNTTINGSVTINNNLTVTGAASATQLETASDVLLTEIATPSNPASGTIKFYAKSDNNLYYLNSSGVETLLSGSTANSVGFNAVYPFVVGSTAQVAAGSANYSSITGALAAASAGNTRIQLLPGTFTENPTSNLSNVEIEGMGPGSIIAGSFTFGASANNSSLKNLTVSSNVTLASGAVSIVTDIFGSSAFTFVDNSASTTTNYLFAMVEG